MSRACEYIATFLNVRWRSESSQCSGMLVVYGWVELKFGSSIPGRGRRNAGELNIAHKHRFQRGTLRRGRNASRSWCPLRALRRLKLPAALPSGVAHIHSSFVTSNTSQPRREIHPFFDIIFLLANMVSLYPDNRSYYLSEFVFPWNWKRQMCPRLRLLVRHENMSSQLIYKGYKGI